MVRKLRGLASSKRHCKKTHRRWIAKFERPPVLTDEKCGHCRYFVPSTGAFPIEWGVCSNPIAKLDGLATMASHGCEQFEKIEGVPLYEGIKENRQHSDNAHERWVEPFRRRSEHRDGSIQCGACRFYIVLEGDFMSDWGMCSNPESPHDGDAKFEHDGCEHHVYCKQGWNGPIPRAHLLRKQRYNTEAES